VILLDNEPEVWRFQYKCAEFDCSNLDETSLLELNCAQLWVETAAWIGGPSSL
jgi:hypothetical protein